MIDPEDGHKVFLLFCTISSHASQKTSERHFLIDLRVQSELSVETVNFQSNSQAFKNQFALSN